MLSVYFHNTLTTFYKLLVVYFSSSF